MVVRGVTTISHWQFKSVDERLKIICFVNKRLRRRSKFNEEVLAHKLCKQRIHPKE